MPLIAGGSSAETLTGGLGNDTIESGGGNDTISGGGGDDLILAFDFSFDGDTDADGGTGNDEIGFGLRGSATIGGGSGDDVLALYWNGLSNTAVDVTLSGPDGRFTYGPGVAVDFTSIEQIRLYASDGNDTVTGGALSDWVNVARGDNLVDTGAGNDEVGYIIGGRSTLAGGAGDDHLAGFVSNNSSYFVVDVTNGTVDDGQLSVISGFERYTLSGNFGNDFAAFGNGDDIMLGYGGNDTVFGRGGDDTLTGGDGADRVSGEAGDDRLLGKSQADWISGGTGNDFLFGGAHDDTLYGGAGNDYFNSGIGSDLLFGGVGDDRFFATHGGDDTLTGGQGADRFIFNASQWSNHQIADFQTGVDRLEFLASSLAVGGLPPGPLAPSLLAFGAAVGSHGQFVLIYDALSDTSQLVWDQNGSVPAGGLIAVVQFVGAVSLAFSDITIL